MSDNQNKSVRKFYYSLKPLLPRRFQIYLRRKYIAKKLVQYSDVWPVNRNAASKPKNWKGWPDQKRFALILTHDVETAIGHDKCLKIMNLEKSLGFKSSFNFVPERYSVSSELRKKLNENGFEVGVHGLNHDGKLYRSKNIFDQRAKKNKSVYQFMERRWVQITGHAS